MAKLDSSVAFASVSSISAPIVEFPDETLEVLDVLLAEFLLLAEVRHERSYTATEHAVEEAMALSRHPFLARECRGIDKAAAFLLRAKRSLLQKAIEERFDRRVLPLAVVRKSGDYVLGRGRAAVQITCMTSDSASLIAAGLRTGMDVVPLFTCVNGAVSLHA